MILLSIQEKDKIKSTKKQPNTKTIKPYSYILKFYLVIFLKLQTIKVIKVSHELADKVKEGQLDNII